MRQKVLAALLAFGCLCGFSATAKAQGAETNWPTRPITMVVAYPPGAITDTVGRRVAERLSQALNVQVLVENRAGAGGNVAAAFGMTAPEMNIKTGSSFGYRQEAPAATRAGLGRVASIGGRRAKKASSA